MRKFLILGLVSFVISGCAQLQTLELAATSTVTPAQAFITGNAYDGIEASANGFLTFCKSNPTNATCNAANRRAVIKYTRAGRAARNQMETYIQTSTSVPVAIYNAVVAAVNNLKSTPASNFVGQ